MFINLCENPVRKKSMSKEEKYIILNMGKNIVKEEYWYKIDTVIRKISNP